MRRINAAKPSNVAALNLETSCEPNVMIQGDNSSRLAWKTLKDAQ
jgi:hypothetical protein